MFHRHGDRSPAKRLVGDSYADAEEEYWRSRVPPGPSLHDALSALYPAEIHLSNNAGKFSTSTFLFLCRCTFIFSKKQTMYFYTFSKKQTILAYVIISVQTISCRNGILYDFLSS